MEERTAPQLPHVVDALGVAAPHLGQAGWLCGGMICLGRWMGWIGLYWGLQRVGFVGLAGAGRWGGEDGGWRMRRGVRK